jgi:hypothetical protein
MIAMQRDTAVTLRVNLLSRAGEGAQGDEGNRESTLASLKQALPGKPERA